MNTSNDGDKTVHETTGTTKETTKTKKNESV
jgi:hypothetical protein